MLISVGHRMSDELYVDMLKSQWAETVSRLCFRGSRMPKKMVVSKKICDLRKMLSELEHSMSSSSTLRDVEKIKYVSDLVMANTLC